VRFSLIFEAYAFDVHFLNLADLRTLSPDHFLLFNIHYYF